MSGSRLGLYLSFQTFSWRSISWFHPAQLTVPVGLQDTSQLQQVDKRKEKKGVSWYGLFGVDFDTSKIKF
jgi:hypothetical protein